MTENPSEVGSDALSTVHNIGLISDTHIPDRADSIAEEAIDFFVKNNVELILHAGDLTEMYVLDQLKEIAPVVAVHGNMCSQEVKEELLEYTHVEINGIQIGLTHGSGGPIGYKDRMLYLAREKGVKILVSGHTHSPYIWKKGGIYLINPGSASGNYNAIIKRHSVALLKIKGMDIEAEIYRF